MNQKEKFETAFMTGMYVFMIGLFVMLAFKLPIWWTIIAACGYYIVVGITWYVSYYRAFTNAARLPRIDLSIAVGNRVLKSLVGIEMVERVKEFVGNAYLTKIDEVIEFPMEDGSIVGIERALMILPKAWDDAFSWRGGRVSVGGYDFNHPHLGEAQFNMVGMLPGTDVPVLVKRDEPRIDLNEIAKTLLPSIDEHERKAAFRYEQLKARETTYLDEPRRLNIDKSFELVKLKERDGVKEPAAVESVTLTHVGTLPGTTMPMFKETGTPKKEPIEEMVDIVDKMFKGWDDAAKRGKTDPSVKI